MATNPPTCNALNRLAKLIDNELKVRNSQGVVDEIKAWNRLLKKHIGQQRRQPNQFDGHRYTYDRTTRKIQRRNGEQIVAEY